MTYVSPPLEIPDPESKGGVSRLDLQVFGVGHRDGSYEVRVFLDQPEADIQTPPDEQHGYAGSYHVFGHGGCIGDDMHCHVPEGPQNRYDVRPSHQLTPQTRVVEVTRSWRRLAESSWAREDEPRVRVTLVPVNGVMANQPRTLDASELFVIDRIALVAYA